MIEDTIKQIEEKIGGLDTIPEARRRELDKLVGGLRREILELAKTRSEEAESIARFAVASAHEVTRKSGSDTLRRLSLDGLKASVESFETSHPRLADAVNHVCMALSDIGI
jgi:hypothetical protein